jgi:hypothetical protein
MAHLRLLPILAALLAASGAVAQQGYGADYDYEYGGNDFYNADDGCESGCLPKHVNGQGAATTTCQPMRIVHLAHCAWGCASWGCAAWGVGS